MVVGGPAESPSMAAPGSTSAAGDRIPTPTTLFGWVLVGAALYAPVAGRETSSFDEGWLFQLGDAGYAAQPTCDSPSPFSKNLSGSICTGGTTIFVSSAELCERACCGNPACTYWQWCEQPCLPVSPGWGCQNGYDACPTKKAAANWTAMARDGTAPPRPQPRPPPAVCADPALPCAPAFADSSWRSVDTPHDFVVEGAYSPDNDKEVSPAL